MYTKEKLHDEIAKIYRKPSEGFMSGDNRTQGATLDDIVKYCWTAYDKARTATGPQVIGRISDIHQAIRLKVSNILEGQTLLDSTTHGNVLSVDKWCLVMNDCWLLGGVHRAAPFVLMSDAAWKNVWNPSITGFVVTAREVIGLREFGYAQEAGTKLGPGSQGTATFTCRNAAKALAADLEDYHLAVALRESRGPLGATDLIT